MINFNEPQAILFFIFGFITVVSSLMVILHKNPVVSAVNLVLTFFALAGIYAIMNDVFIATMQVLVYAGAIMVLVVFVLMLLSIREETQHIEYWNHPFKKVIIVLIVTIYGSLLICGVKKGQELGYLNSDMNIITGAYEYPLNPPTNSVITIGNTAAVGASTMLDYLPPFEMISVLLLVAVIGAVIIAKKDLGEKKN